MPGSLDDFHVLVLPGWHGSGPTHWQSHWQLAFPAFERVEQQDWDAPVHDAWRAPLWAALSRATKPVVLVGHSLGTSLTMNLALRGDAPQGLVDKVAGAFLVAPTDRDMRDKPDEGPQGFGPMLLARMPFPSLILASSDDEYVSIPRARLFASAWGSRLVEMGPLGHMGETADLGLWPQGLVLFGEFLASLRRPS